MSQKSVTNNRSKETQKVGIVGIIGNIFLFCIKIAIGLFTGSQAMIADSLNSGTDILSSLMTFIGGKIAGTPSDDDHNYGHGKAEYIFSMLISVVTVYLSLKIAIDGIKSLIFKNEFIFSIWLLIVCGITIIVKLCLYAYTNKKGMEEDNILILANAQDHINDVMITGTVIIGTIAALFNIYWLDGIVAIGISVRICYIGVRFFVDSYNVLMDRAMPDGEKETIADIIKRHGEIDHIDKITSKTVGNQFIVIIKVSVNGEMTVNKSHEIVGKLKEEVLKIKNIYDVVVHVNPV